MLLYRISNFRYHPIWGILTSGKDFVLTSGKKLNYHQWERKFIPLVRKKYFLLVRIYMKKNSHQWEENGGNGGKGRNGEEEGGKGLLPMLLEQDYGHETQGQDQIFHTLF